MAPGVVQVLLSMLAVVAVWLLLGALVTGVGLLAGRVLLGRSDGEQRPRPAHFWIGFAVLTLYVLLWSLVAPVGGWAWAAPVAAGAAGLAPSIGRLRGSGRPGTRLPSSRITALVVGGALLAANMALGPALGYDLGLYHLSAIDYASDFGTVPGLGNLHDRLGTANPHLLVATLIGDGPLSQIGFRLTNGLLVGALLVEIASRAARGATGARAAPYTRRVALLLLPALLVTMLFAGGIRITGPDLDLAAFVLVAAGMLYLAEGAERGFSATAALAGTAALATAAATRPVYWPLLAMALALAVASERRSGRSLALLLRVLVVPLALLGGVLARQAILSGYPLFPATTIRLPVDWRLPVEAADEAGRVVAAWARQPNRPPDEVLGSWDWLRPWLSARSKDPDVLGPLLLLVAAVPGLAYRSARDTERRRQWRRPLLALLIPLLVTIALWFAAAPDPRFVLGPLWVTAAACAAWTLPERRPRGRAWGLTLAHGALAAALVLALGGTMQKARYYHPNVATGEGPLGTEPVPVPELVVVRTESGLVLVRPRAGDQCWRAVRCAPQPGLDLRLRGDDVADGFRTGR
jgi:hypothetical protein